MANSTIPGLAAVTVPALTDLFGVRQSGDTRDKKLTVSQLSSLIGGGDVSKVGTPANNQLGVWTGDGTIEGDANLLWSGTILTVGGTIRVANNGGGAILSEQVTLTNPSIITDVGDVDTGFGSGGTNSIAVIVGAQTYSQWRATGAGDGALEATYDLTTGKTASTIQTQGQATQNSPEYSEITTVANPNDVITLGAAAVGRKITVVNRGANVLQIFPTSGGDLGQGLNASTTLAVGHSITWLGAGTAGVWAVIGFSDDQAGGGDVTKVGTPVLGELGVWTGDGTLEGASELVFGSNTFVVNLSGGDLRLTGKLELQGANRPAVLDESSSHTNATLAPLGNSPGSGLGGQGTSVALVANGSAALVARQLTGGVLQSYQGNQGIVAFAGGGQGSATILRSSYSVIGTVATTGDSVQLPPLIESVSDPYTIVFIKNDGANACDVFPELGHDLGAGINVAESLAAGKSVSYIATSATTWTKWIVDTAGGGGGDVTKVGTPANDELAVWTGDGTLEGSANFDVVGTSFQSALGNGPAMLNEAASGINPTLVPRQGDNNTGIGNSGDGRLTMVADGVIGIEIIESAGTISVVNINGGAVFDGDFRVTNAAGPQIRNEAASATNPTFTPNRADADSGIGQNAVDNVSIIAGGVEIARATEAVVDQFIISPGALLGSAALPSLAFGDGDSGLRESVDDTLKVTLLGVDRWTFTGDRFVAVAGNGPSLQNEASTATNPTLIPALGDVSTGIGGVTGFLELIVGGASAMHIRKAGADLFVEGTNTVYQSDVGVTATPTYSFNLDADTGMYNGGAGSDELKFSAGGVEALSLNELNSGVIQAHQANIAITAFATGGQASATQLDESYNVITTVATTGDSVKLPPVFAVNSVVYIKNNGANAADVFPATGDNLGAGLNTAVSLAAGASVSFIATVASSTWTQWIVSAGGGGGDVTKVGTPVNNQIGVWTGDGTLEGDANLIWDGSKLDITTGRIELPAGSAATPSVGFQIDTGTGIYRVSNNNFGIASGGLHSVNWLRQTGQIVQTNSLDTGFTASTTQTQGNGNIFSSYTVVSTVANANDVVTAMIALAGKRLTIYNDGANILQVFPSSGDDMGAGVNSSITIAVGASKSWIANDGTTWLLIGSAP